VLLLAVPLFLAILVYYFTRNQEKVYQSEAIIYTGITTGYSIESTTQRPTDFFSTSAQFDNMINLLTSRQTIVETAIRLYAQDLSLEHYNRQYISKENYEKLMRETPKMIKDLVVKNGKSGVEREKEEQIRQLEKEIKSLEKEISKKKNKAIRELNQYKKKEKQNQSVDYGVTKNSVSTDNGNALPEFHTVLPGESITAIAARYGISRGELINMNGLDPNEPLSPGQNLIIKKPAVSTTMQYHTVKPGETLYSIAKRYGVNISKLRELNNLYNRNISPGQRLIISSGTSNGNSAYDFAVKQVSEDNYPENTASVTVNTAKNENKTSTFSTLTTEGGVFVKDPIIPPGINKEDYEATVRNMKNYYASSDTNYIYGLLHYGQSKHYSIWSISQVQIYRINNSDLVKLTFKSDDPGICQQTLKILSTVFMRNYKLLRINETDLVVKYFEQQVDSADKRLQEAEDRLLRFNKKNNIINYYEQSKYIAAQKEDLDVYYQNEQIRLSASSAPLRELESKMTARDSIYLKSDVINQRKKELAEVSEKILINQLAANYDDRVAKEIARLKRKQKQLRDEIKLYADQLYLYGHSTQGVPIKQILDEWLKNTIDYVEAKASLSVLSQRKLDFIRTYQKYAPLGAMLTRIEREIKVAEQTYLELLRSLNVAKMKQQNLEMSTNIKIVDPPYFPIQANPSKAKFMVIAAFLAGFVIIAFIIVALEYFDTSVKNPSRVVEKTKMKLAGAYPALTDKEKAMALASISNRLVDMTIQNIKLGLSKIEKEVEKPYVILVFSTQNRTGKTLISQKVINRLRTIGDKVLYLNYAGENESLPDEDYNYSYTYRITDNFIDIENLGQLIGENYLRKVNSAYDYIFIEIPSIIYHSYPLKLLKEVHMALFVIKATQKITKADEAALETFGESLDVKPIVILNQVDIHSLDEIITEIPKKRNGFMGKIKRILTYPGKYKIQIKKEA
jgi:LysM repeat protein/uncharacterized protein involved in exopolysaccharide biosynthesis